ncbi:MAG: ABC transporter permease [Deltaproteobacteria bacterium]|nr:MAG: ABC transporter permease [Deltaproteobacteria bacterium]
MTLALRMALRNVRRHARRSLITAITIAGCVFMMLLTIGVSEGSYREVVNTAARSGSGHVVVREPGADLVEPAVLAHSEQAMAAVAAVDGHAVPRLKRLVLAQGSGGAATVVALGVDPEAERHTSVLPEATTQGSWFEKDGRVASSVIGGVFARQNGLSLGDRLVLSASRDGQVNTVLTRVTGIFEVGSDDVDANLVVVERPVLGELVGAEGGMDEIAVVLDDIDEVDAVARKLSAALPESEVLTWAQAVPALGDFVTLDRTGANLSFFVLFGLVSLAILNAVLMSVFERTREFGVLLAVGTRPRLLFTVVLLESAMLALISTTLGAVVAWAVVAWLGDVGIDVYAISGLERMDVGGYQLAGALYPYLPAERTFRSLALVPTLAVLAALYPAWSATRIPPVEAMRHV